jgi:hypothetical protein
MNWQFSNALKSFSSYEHEWDSRNKRVGNHILLDSRLIASLLRYYSNGQEILLARETSAGSGMCLLIKVGVGRWSTFQPSQAPIGLMMCETGRDPYQSLQELLRSLPGCALQISILQQDPAYSSFPRNESDPNIRSMDYISTSRLTTAGDFQDYWKSRSRNLKHNLDRQARKLHDEGHRIELHAVTDPDRIASCVVEHGRLESKGWKEKEGTAISEHNTQGRFYQEIMALFARSSEAVAYYLTLDGQVVASDLCVVRNGMIIVLKTAYDESVKGFSPALLMRKLIMEQLFQDPSINVVEFYGRVRDWHLQWTSDVRTMYHIDYYRNNIVTGTVSWLRKLRSDGTRTV